MFDSCRGFFVVDIRAVRSPFTHAVLVFWFFFNGSSDGEMQFTCKFAVSRNREPFVVRVFNNCLFLLQELL